MKKAVFVNPNFYHSIKNYDHEKENELAIYCRNSTLLPVSIGSTVKVHNGIVYLKVHVSENIIGHKLGEFSISRRRYFFKKGKAKQKNKK